MKAIDIVFIWNYKQAYLKDQSNNYILPVIRQYLQRDYIDMIKISQKYPKLRLNFNIPPFLIEQLSDYVTHHADDYNWRLSQKNAEKLSLSEKEFILKHFFKGVDNLIIHPYPRYLELYKKKLELEEKEYIDSYHAHFSTEEIRDLQVWHNLSWIGKESQQASLIQNLLKKSTAFTENDKSKLFKHLSKLQEKVFDLYESSLTQHRIELSTTAFYNPIMPLALDNQQVFLNEDNDSLPLKRFTGESLLMRQILYARKFGKRIFKQSSLGIQASDSMLNNKTLELFAKSRFSWTLLEKHHLAYDLSPEDSSQVYRYSANKRHAIHCFVNQSELSDKFHQLYPNLDPQEAVDDFFNSLYQIQKRLKETKSEKNAVITISVSGDQLWDKFENKGLEFLNRLYNAFEANSDFKTSLASEFLAQNKTTQNIRSIREESSKINYSHWIGSNSANRAWDQLSECYQFYLKKEAEAELSEKKLRDARQKIQIALNADYFRWYSSNDSIWDLYYDELFRNLLISCYEDLYEKPPIALFYNLKNELLSSFSTKQAKHFIYPELDGNDSSFDEWSGAAYYDIHKYQIDNQKPLYRYINSLSIGYNEKELCFRISFESFPSMLSHFQIDFHSPLQSSYRFYPLLEKSERFEGLEGSNTSLKAQACNAAFECDELWECTIPIQELKLDLNDFFTLQVQLHEKEQCIERFPKSNVIRMIYQNEK